LPANKTDGVPAAQTGGINTTNIPLTAISTGNVDALECVLLKMGVDQAEFTANTASGRIHIYGGGSGFQGSGATSSGPGATVNGSNAEPTLMNGNSGTYMNYDQMMFPCWGRAASKTNDELAALVTYADSGGHFFATHYSYTWLVQNGEFNDVAAWDPDFNNPGDATWTLNVSTVPPVAPAPLYSGIFYQWLNYVNALSNATGSGIGPPQSPLVAIGEPRHDADGVASGSLAWISGTDPQKNDSLVEHFTFDTPVHATQQCGHAIFSDFHVTNSNQTNGQTFPAECDNSAMTAQERVLEYMIFDLASCVTPPTTSCTPRSCAAQGLQCGQTGDGCGNPLDCGTCTPPLTCGGGGQPGVCGEPDGGACTPNTDCTGKCGAQGDGCGGTFNCACPAGTTCGGAGVANQCGAPEAGTCVPRDCAAAGVSCGFAGDGCGNAIQCGTCTGGQTCGGAGTAGMCGMPDGGENCAPLSCAAQGIQCGLAGDGCGAQINCGTCPTGQTCGGGGVAGKCGGVECVPTTCAALGYNCGVTGDGCGGPVLNCGVCTSPATCGGGGTLGVCGTPAIH
jgi:hypothetical protein